LISLYAFFLIVCLNSDLDKSENFSSCHVIEALPSHCKVQIIFNHKVSLSSPQIAN